MKFTVTRQQVIKALKTEPLMSGSFAHENSLYSDGTRADKFKNNANCAVCAVGCIIDKALGKNANEETIQSIGSDITTAATLGDRFNVVENAEYVTDATGHVTLAGIKRLAKEASAKGKHMSALSMLFEGMMGLYDVEYSRRDGLANAKAREILINFVKSNFPSKLNIDTRKSY